MGGRMPGRSRTARTTGCSRTGLTAGGVRVSPGRLPALVVPVIVLLLLAAPLAQARPFSATADAAVAAAAQARAAHGGRTYTPPSGDTHHWRGDGGNSNWSTAGNWSPASAPSNGDTLVFDVDATTKIANNDISGLSLAGVSTFGDGYTITGQAVTLNGTMSCVGSCTWSPDVILTATRQFDVGVGASMTISGKVGPFLVPTPTPGLTKTGTGSLTLSGTSPELGAVTVSAGTLVVDGSVTVDGTVSVAAGATLRGVGTLGAMYLGSPSFLDLSGALDPGHLGVGILTTGGQTWESGGSFTVHMDSATGSAGAGPGWNKLACTNGITVAATSAARFTIKLNGAPADFKNGDSYHWLIASAAAAPSGVDPADFTVDTSSFTPPGNTPTGDFWVNSDASGVYLDYGPPHTAHHWSGLGADDNWSTAANWLEHAAPTSGDSLVFPAHETTETANNDLAAVFPSTRVTLAGVTIGDGGYVITGKAVTLAGDMTRSGGEGTSSWSPAIMLEGSRRFDVEEGALAVSGAISPSVVPSVGVALEKTGAGTLALSGACTFTLVDASAGTLLVNGQLSHTGPFSIAAGATLGGAGTISYTGVHADLVTVAGTLAPGDAGTVGTLTTGNEAWANHATLEIHMDAAAGTRGSSPGWSSLESPSVSIPGTGIDLHVKLVSVGDVTDFDPAGYYTWKVASFLPETPQGSSVTVDASGFTPTRAPTGIFSGHIDAGGRVSVMYTPRLSVLTPEVASGAASVAVGSRQQVTWRTDRGVDAGSFDVVAVDGGQVETTVVAGVPADGTSVYSAEWTVLQKAGSGWTVKVVYDGDSVSPASAAFKIVNPALAVTAPVTGASWSRGTTETVSWTTTPALAGGSFRVWATPAAGGTTRAVSTTVVPVVPGQAAYELPCRWTLPSGDWKLSVYYYAAGTSFTCQNPVKPLVTVPATWTITSSKGSGGTISPLGVTSVENGGSQSYTITASSGYHVKDVLVDGQSVGTSSPYEFTNVTADHTIAAAFERNPGITVTAPSTDSEWSRGTTETVSWTVSPTVSVGSFRVWATPVAGGTTRAVSTTVVPVVPLQAAYSLDCKWTLPAGDWKLSVYYYAGTVFTSQNAVKPTVHVP